MLNGFAAAVTGVSTSPPSAQELITFTTRFVNQYQCFDTGLCWGPNKVNRMVTKFRTRFPLGSWLMFWGFLAWEISDSANRKIAARAVADLQKVIDYTDPTGEMAVRNVMRRIN